MRKIFLYLYPIEEFFKVFMYKDEVLYDIYNEKKPLPILEECIQKRYRDNGYQVVFALYPDKNIFGLIPQKEDKIIYTDVTFNEAIKYKKDGTKKKDFMPKYPNEKLLIQQLTDIDELVIGGFHAMDCVKRVGEVALNLGIDTLVDLDLTDFFFHLYKKNHYFNIFEYNPMHYKEYILNEMSRHGEDFAERIFERNYNSPIYGFSKNKFKIKLLN